MATLDIYQAVTDRIIELLEQGTVHWKQPIRSQGGSGRLPTNLLSHREYRGINVFLLAVTAWAEGYESPYWLTFKQTKEKGGHVRKGEKGSLVIFWKQHATEDNWVLARFAEKLELARELGLHRTRHGVVDPHTDPEEHERGREEGPKGRIGR